MNNLHEYLRHDGIYNPNVRYNMNAMYAHSVLVHINGYASLDERLPELARISKSNKYTQMALDNIELTNYEREQLMAANAQFQHWPNNSRGAW